MVSDHFFRAFVTGGSPVVECDFCGRTYYSTTMLEEDELAYYNEKYAEKPSKYYPEPFDSIEYLEVAGRRYACECQCNALEPYEAFIWDHRDRILDYLENRTTEMHTAAVIEKGRVDEAIVVHTNAKKVAAALTEAERKLAWAKDY